MVNQTKSLHKIRQLYEIIMNGEYTKHMKEILIFSLWFQIHESVINPINPIIYPYEFFYIPDIRDFFLYTEIFDHIDSELRKDILNHYEEIFGWMSHIYEDYDMYESSEYSMQTERLLHTIENVASLYIHDIRDQNKRNFKQYLEDSDNDDNSELRFRILFMYGCYLLNNLLEKVRE